MYRLSSIVVLFLWACTSLAQEKNTHGENFKIDCKACHHANGWDVKISEVAFDHKTTTFQLEGRHNETDCKSCHKSLEFAKAPSDCFSCHDDVHSMSVGNDCARCHTSNNWLVDYIPELHEQNGFPLLGAHNMLSCVDCHQSETNLRWDRLGNECSACHIDRYYATTDPNHPSNSQFFSTNCDECHEPISLDWSAGNFHTLFALTGVHNVSDCNQCHLNSADFSDISSECISCHLEDYNSPFTHPESWGTDCAQCHLMQPDWPIGNFANHNDLFPLTGGHNGPSCSDCHLNPNDYGDVGTDCVSCHLDDYNSATKPNHSSYNLSNNCEDCHTTNPGWRPATFADHDNLLTFPIYNGEHAGEWSSCTDCHTNPNDITQFNCLICHSKNDMDDEHDLDDVPNYVYVNNECFVCHPNGEKP